MEARHRAHAVAVEGGAIVASAGDPALITHFRSSAKPIQALPLVRARSDLDDVEIAIACASHLARPEQLAAVRSLLAKAPAGEDDLECGTRGADTGPTPIEHNCSGKHAGMLALCRARGWPIAGYRLLEHPCQQAMLVEVAAAAEVDPRRRFRSLSTAAGSPRSHFRSSGWRTRSPGSQSSTAERARSLRCAHTPSSSADPGSRHDAHADPAWVGREGRRRGIALRRLGGRARRRAQGRGRCQRAVRCALAAFLVRLGLACGELGEVPIENSRGEIVGELRAV